MFINKINVEPELLYLILTIALVFLVLGFNFSHTNYSFAQSNQFSQLQNASKTQAILRFQSQFCGMNSTLHSNSFIAEYPLPQKCEMQLGILVDNNTVWYSIT